MKDRTDIELVKLSQGGNKDAYNEICVRYYTRILNYSKNNTRSIEDAEDIAQQVFVNTFLHIKNIDPNKLSQYFYRAAKNYCINIMRNKARRPDYVSLDQGDKDEKDEVLIPHVNDFMDLLLLKEEIEVLRKVIEQLPPKYKEILKMKFYTDMSWEEIAAILKINKYTVKSRYQRAVNEILPKLMGEQDG